MSQDRHGAKLEDISDCTTTSRIGGPVAYAEDAGHEALGGYPGDFLWGCDIAPVVGWCWHSGMYSRKCVANERGKSRLGRN